MRKSGLVFLAMVVGLLSLSCAGPAPPVVESDAIAFVDVDVIPMDGERVLRNQTVVVESGLIVSVGEVSEAEVPTSARRIDGSGRYLIPGLCDMHVHLEGQAWNMMFPPEAQFPAESLDFGELLFPYVANGVTTVQVLSALPEHIGVRERIAAGEILGPRLVLLKMIDGPERAWPPPISTWVGSAEEARQAVIEAHEAGYDGMKVYSFLDRESFDAIVATARELGMDVGGHLPFALSLEDVLAANLDFIAHSEEVIKHLGGDFSRDNIERVALEIAKSGTWMTPTLTTSRHVLAVLDDFEAELARPEVRFMHPMAVGVWKFIHDNLYAGIPSEHRVAIRRGFEDFQRPFTMALHSAGGRIMTGTDALVPSNVPGFAIHDELAELVGVGMSPYEALRASTTRPHEFLGELDRAGTVEVGKRADLVLLGGNPLEDIGNTKSITGVMVAGRWVSAEEIQTGLGD